MAFDLNVKQVVNQIKRISYNTWAPEYGATGLSLAFMVAIVALLAVYNGKSLSDWALPTISPNAVIAALNTLSRVFSGIALSSALGQWKWISICREQCSLKTFVYIDECSKGSFGSLKILWDTRGRAWVSIGATLIILNLASNTFMQQVITVQPATEPQKDPSVIVNRAFAYEPGGLSPRSSMRGALEQALAVNSPAGLPEAPFSCSSGNCSYPEFESLGVCSSCVDVTNLLTVSTYDAAIVGNLTQNAFRYMNVTLGNPDNGTVNQQSPVIMNTTATGFDRSWFYGRDGTTTSINLTAAPITNYTKPDTLNFIFAMSIINLTNIDSLKTWPKNAKPEATECSLFWCVQNVSSTVSDGALRQTQIGRGDITSTPRGINDSTQEGSIDLIGPDPSDTNYTVSYAGALLVSKFLVQDLLGLVDPEDSNNQDSFVYGPTAIFYDPDHQEGAYGNPAIQAIFANGNFSKTFDILAQAMTFQLYRTDNITAMTGSRDVSYTQIVVRWEWITLPLGNILSSVIFLVFTITASERARAPSWKASLLPTLLHRFDATDARRKATDQLDKLSEMQTYARTIDIQLRYADDGISIIRKNPTSRITRRSKRDYVEVTEDQKESAVPATTELRDLPSPSRARVAHVQTL